MLLTEVDGPQKDQLIYDKLLSTIRVHGHLARLNTVCMLHSGLLRCLFILFNHHLVCLNGHLA